MSLKISIMVRAVKIRVENGEDVDKVLNSYTKLTDAERSAIKAEVLK